MTVSVTKIYAGGTSDGGAEVVFNSSTSFSSGAFTPGNNCLLVVIVNTQQNVASTLANITLSDTASLSWTKQTALSGIPFAGGFSEGLVLFTAPVTTGSSTTLTSGGWTSGTADCKYYFEVYQVTGHDTSTSTSWKGATAVNAANGTDAATLTLSAAPASSSVIFSACNTAPNAGSATGVSAGSGWSLLNSYSAGAWNCCGAQTKTGTTSTSVAWTDVITADTIYNSDSVVMAMEIIAAAGGPSTPSDCSFLFQPTQFRRPVPIVNVQERKAYPSQANATPTQLSFWFQPPFLGPTPKSTQDTNQAFSISPQEPKTPTSALTFRPHALLRHVPTIYTAQSFVCNPTIGPPVPVDAFWIQPPDLLNHPHSLDTNQPFNAGFAGVPGVTPADCSFLFQPSALLHHVPTLDTNQLLDDTFFGWAGNSVTPTGFGFFTQAPDLLRHPATLDTRQQFEFNPPPGAVTPADCSFLYQPSALLNHPATLDTNQSLDDTFFGWQKGVTPTALGFWTQAPDLTRHPATLDTNQSTVSYQDKATPSALGFWTQAPDLLRHASTIDTNQAFVFNPPVPGATPSALWWFQPPDLLRHPPHLDTNQPRLVSQFGATPSAFGFWRQPEDLLKHPATLNTQQSFKYLPPPQPPFGWLIQAQDLLRHPIPFILGMQPFAELPPVIHTNRLTKVYFFD